MPSSLPPSQPKLWLAASLEVAGVEASASRQQLESRSPLAVSLGVAEAEASASRQQLALRSPLAVSLEVEEEEASAYHRPGAFHSSNLAAPKSG